MDTKDDMEGKQHTRKNQFKSPISYTYSQSMHICTWMFESFVDSYGVMNIHISFNSENDIAFIECKEVRSKQKIGRIKKGKMFFWAIKHLLQDIYGTCVIWKYIYMCY